MRSPALVPLPLVLGGLLLTAGCLADTADDEIVDLGVVGGKTDNPLACRDAQVASGQIKRFRVSGGSVRAELEQEDAVPVQLSLKSFEIDIYGDVSARPSVEARLEEGDARLWTIRVHNVGEQALTGQLCVWALEEPDPDYEDRLPTLGDPVQYANEWCTYGDSIPYVRSVNWDHPLVRDALRALGPGWRSTFTYRDWNVGYGLEHVSSAMSDTERRDRTSRNVIRVICGDHRDYPAMIERKLRLLAEAHVYASPDEMTAVDTSENLFTQLTLPAYERMVKVMGAVYAHKQAQLNPGAGGSSYHYGFGAYGHGSRRVDNGVPPWTHCEMKFMFERYMVASAPATVDPAQYLAEYEVYADEQCEPEDFEWMYNFRGHRNFMPLWLESNAFVWNSRRARWAELHRGDNDYYQRPFAGRYHRSRQALATFLLYPEEHHQQFIAASESGGGYITYITDQDTDGNGLSDYRLFDERGCGDQGVNGTNPSSNCNMVWWSVAASTPNTTGHLSTWDPSWWTRADLGFMDAVTTFEDRMARFNQALDRHTNWGPTGYYVIDGGPEDKPKFIGAYSPIVAASYEISKSDWFARRDLSNTHDFERGRLKWMFVMKFRAEDYYDEADLADGRAMDFDRHYFNETSLSNDYYREHALDRFGWVPNEAMHANIYFTYADHGQQPPALEDIPTP